jgi:hypothetical protein
MAWLAGGEGERGKSDHDRAITANGRDMSYINADGDRQHSLKSVDDPPCGAASLRDAVLLVARRYISPSKGAAKALHFLYSPRGERIHQYPSTAIQALCSAKMVHP